MAIEYTTWNPSDKSANITLSNGDLTATATNTAWKSVRAILGKSSGKWYWEITISAGTSSYHIIGAGTLNANINSYVGSNTYGYGYNGYNGKKFHNTVSLSYGSTFGLNDIIGIALDLDNGKIWWSKNGVWQASGDPVAGTNEAYSGLSGTFYPMYSPYTNTSAATANFGESVFSYSVPSGFNSGFYTGVDLAFIFSNPIPAHLSTVYGVTKQLQLVTTVSGEEGSYVYNAAFYNGSDVQIGTTVSGINSGSPVSSNADLPTPSGVDYSWYVVVTSSGSGDTSSTYIFSNRFLYEGYVTENDNPVNRVVRLYYRDTGELIDSTTSSGDNGYYSIDATINDEHFIVAFDDEAGEDYNSLILDRLLPNEE